MNHPVEVEPLATVVHPTLDLSGQEVAREQDRRRGDERREDIPQLQGTRFEPAQHLIHLTPR